MFCEKCGARLEEGAQFCEKCGAKVNEKGGAGETVRADTRSGFEAGGPKGNFSANEFGGLLKSFFKDPTAAFRSCGSRDYSMYAMMLLGGKDLLTALICAVFKDIIGSYATGFYWMYGIPAPLVFVLMLVMLLIGDCGWLGLCIGLRKIIDKNADPKTIVGAAALGQLYLPAIAVIGIILIAAFGYVGAYIGIIAMIAVMAFFQYESLTASSPENEKGRMLYGAAGAVFVYIILWVAMMAIVSNIYSYYGFY